VVPTTLMVRVVDFDEYSQKIGKSLIRPGEVASRDFGDFNFRHGCNERSL
jgi:hypothetical protein